MKIALVCPFSFSYHGGVQKHVLALKEEFKKLGHACKIIVPRQRKDEAYGPEVILLGSSFIVPANATRGDISWVSPWELETSLKDERFDLFHHHSVGPFISLQIAEFARKHGLINVYTSHSNPDKSFVVQNLPIVFWPFFNYFLGFMDGTISVSGKASQMIKDYQGPKAIIPNGISTEKFSRLGPKIEGLQEDDTKVLFVGRLDERKGILIMIEAFDKLRKRVPKTRLLVVGEGFLGKQAHDLVSKKGLKNVEFFGAVTDEDLPKYYRSAQIFCAPSLGAETFGMVLLEAMASGLPVVASNIEGYKEVITGKGAELLVKAYDVDGLAQTLERLVNDESGRREFSAWGQKEVEKYSWERVSKEILEFYERVKSLKAKPQFS